MSTYILRWRDICRSLLLHLCSLLRIKTYLTISTREGGVGCSFRWHCRIFVIVSVRCCIRLVLQVRVF
jgi:hypothetical protein